jgi:alkanesulfonate monooxygenase
VTLEFIGMIQPRLQSETHAPSGPSIDPEYLRASVLAHDEGGFDRILIGWFSNGPDGLQIAAHAAAYAHRISFLVAHRPGFMSPTNAARAYASLDQLSNGRAAIHIISGGDDVDQRRDGDWTTKDERYARTDEYVSILKSVWTADRPVDFSGRFYRIAGAMPDVRCVQQPRPPIFFGGASDAAVRVAGKHADVYMLWGETHEQVREITARVRAEAARNGRQIRFSLSFRPILAETEARAWQRAEDIRADILRTREKLGMGLANLSPANTGSQRLLAAAARGERIGRLWTGAALATGARGNTTALVGTAEQVAAALAEYHSLGVDAFLVRGFEPLADAMEFGRSLLPATRALLARNPVRSVA